MSNLSINVQVGNTPPATGTTNGPGLTVQAWKASLFLRNPARSQGVPAGSPDSTGTTDGSGNATFTGLSSVNYWILVIDARGVTNWFPVQAVRIGGADVFVCTIPWSTPTSVTSPLDDRGGDTQGGRTNQGLFAPRTHIHQIPAAPASGLGKLIFQATLAHGGGTGVTWQSGGGSIPLPSSFYDPYGGHDGTGYTVPAAVVALNVNLWVDCILEWGGAPDTSNALVVTAQILRNGGGAIGESPLTVPPGSTPVYGTLVVNGPYAFGATLSDTYNLAYTLPNAFSSNMVWGPALTSNGFFTQMRIFAC